jgi:O-antigen/teichoic acid export membrane protein
MSATASITSAEVQAPAAGGGRIRRAVMTWTSGAAYTAVTVLVGLIATPVIVDALGEARFGAFRAMTDWMGYVLLADAGLGSALAVALVRANGEGADRVAAVLRQGIRVLAPVAAGAVVIGLALAWYMPALVRSGSDLAFELRTAAAVTALGLALLPLAIFRSYLDATQRGYLINIALLAQSLAVTGLSVLLALSGHGIVGQAVAVLAGLLLFMSLIVGWSRPLLAKQRSPAGAALSRGALWSLSWPLALTSIGGRLNLMTDTVVVGGMLGVGEVATLFLTQRVILLCATQVNGLATSSWAALAELRQSGAREAFESRLAELTRLIVGAGLVLVGTAAALDREFVGLWVGPHLYGGDLLAFATMAGVVVLGFVLPFTWAIDMAGDTRRRLLPSTIGSLLNLALSILLVRRWGIAGVAVGTLLGYLMTDAWYCPRLVCRSYGVRLDLMLRAAGRGAAVGLVWVGALWFVTRSVAPSTEWIEFIIRAALAGSAALAYCWLAVLRRDERNEWLGRLG